MSTIPTSISDDPNPDSSTLFTEVDLTLKPVFHLATLFARREAKTKIRHRDWLKLAGEKIRSEQVGTVPTFLSVRANKSSSGKRA